MNEREPCVYDFPEPYWTIFRKQKVLDHKYLVHFGELILRTLLLNAKLKQEFTDRLLELGPQDNIVIHIASDEPEVHDIPFELVALPELGFLQQSANVAVVCGPLENDFLIDPVSPPYNLLAILALPVETYLKSPIDPLQAIQGEGHKKITNSRKVETSLK